MQVTQIARACFSGSNKRRRYQGSKWKHRCHHQLKVTDYIVHDNDTSMFVASGEIGLPVKHTTASTAITRHIVDMALSKTINEGAVHCRPLKQQSGLQWRLLLMGASKMRRDANSQEKKKQAPARCIVVLAHSIRSGHLVCRIAICSVGASAVCAVPPVCSGSKVSATLNQ